MIEALYLHIPFCVSRCAYCDFATRACADEAAMDTYVDQLCIQLRRASKAGLLGGIKTIYIGGGTPTHLGARRLNSLVYLISLSVNLENVQEFTIECNPESLTSRMVKDLFALGVDRFSIGVQSFDDAVLKRFGRAHSASQAREAVQAAQERCANVSVDLICGAPGQTMESWRASLKEAVKLGVSHVSIYPLMVEEGTPLASQIESGACEAPDEDVQADMMLVAEEVLRQAGMERYEVASYALPGCESKHNTAYWTGVGYLGLGNGAASMMNANDFEACQAAGLFEGVALPENADATNRVRIQSDLGGALELEVLNSREALLEDVMLGFRRSQGISAHFTQKVVGEVPELAKTLYDLEAKGLLSVGREGRIVPTERGWLMGNEVFGAIWDLAVESDE